MLTPLKVSYISQPCEPGQLTSRMPVVLVQTSKETQELLNSLSRLQKTPAS